MSRIRTIKPEFWTSEQIVSCSLQARLLFIGLWNFCDDNGVHSASYMRLKGEIFPIDNFSLEEIKKWVDELIKNNLLSEYSVEGKPYWIVTGWKSHQKIEKPTYRHPLPQSALKVIGDNSTNRSKDSLYNSTISHQLIDDDSASTHRLVEDSSATESNGMESKRMDKDIYGAEAPHFDCNKNFFNTEVQEIFEHWQLVMNHPHAKLDTKRTSKIKQALKLGYSISDLKEAISGCARTPFNMGENERRQRYDDITLILRDATHIEQFMEATTNYSIEASKACQNYAEMSAGAI